MQCPECPLEDIARNGHGAGLFLIFDRQNETPSRPGTPGGEHPDVRVCYQNARAISGTDILE